MAIFEWKPCYMKRLAFLILSISFVLSSCHNEIGRQLDYAEMNIHEHPDSVLERLSKLNTSKLRTKREKARYALWMSAALDKNYIDVSSDSLIRQAVEYYSHHRNKRKEMLAWYYDGIILRNAKSFPSAIVALENAERVAKALEDVYQLGLIFRNKADVFNATNNNIEAIANRRKAIQCFEKIEASSYTAYAELALAIDLANNEDYQESYDLLERVKNQYDDSNIQYRCRLRQAGILVERNEDPVKAIKYYQSIPRHIFGLLDYAYCAVAFERNNQPDSSDFWMEEGYKHAHDQADSASLDFPRSRIEKARGNSEMAFRLVNHAASVQDSLTLELLQQSVVSAQKDYFKSEVTRQEEKVKLMKRRRIADAFIALLIFALTGGILLFRNREKDRQLKEQMARLALKDQELERIQRDNAHLVGSLFSERISRLDKLSRDYFRLEDKTQKERIYREVKQNLSSLQKDESLFASLEKDLNRYCNGIMEKLRTQVPKIKGENLKIIALFFAGYPYETVQLLLNKVSVESLKTARSRFRKEILNANAPDGAFFLDMLEMKRRPQTGTNESGDC